MALPNYNPMYNPYQNPYPQITPVQQPNQNVIIWVQGEAAAKAYPVQPGTSVFLMDSETDCFYVKSVDNSGMPQKLRKFSYTEITDEIPVPKPSQESTPKYITEEELERRLAEFSRPHYNNNKGYNKKEEKVNE